MLTCSPLLKMGLRITGEKKSWHPFPLAQVEITLRSRPADYELNNSELQLLYQQSVNTLIPQCREVFKLSGEEEMTYPQIVEKMNLSVNTVKSHMLAALKGMRLKLAHYTDLSLVYLIILLSLFS